MNVFQPETLNNFSVDIVIFRTMLNVSFRNNGVFFDVILFPDFKKYCNVIGILQTSITDSGNL